MVAALGWAYSCSREFEVVSGILSVVRATSFEMVGEDETSGLKNCWVACQLGATVQALVAGRS